MTYTKEQILAEIDKLYTEIDECISDLLKARLNHDKVGENSVHFRMERIMIGVQQDLTVINNYIKED